MVETRERFSSSFEKIRLSIAVPPGWMSQPTGRGDLMILFEKPSDDAAGGFAANVNVMILRPPQVLPLEELAVQQVAALEQELTDCTILDWTKRAVGGVESSYVVCTYRQGTRNLTMAQSQLIVDGFNLVVSSVTTNQAWTHHADVFDSIMDGIEIEISD